MNLPPGFRGATSRSRAECAVPPAGMPAWAGVRAWSRKPRPARGFTLVEIMIVISIVAIIIAAGVPTVFNSFKKDALKKAVNDLVEGCSHARAQAILQGVPSEFIVRAEDGAMTVRKVAIPAAAGMLSGAEESPAQPAPADGSKPDVFTAKLGEDIAVEFLDLNFRDQMEEPETRVRFFPNGTSDEFTVILSSTQGSYKISLEIVTGLASVERIR